jgi:hypothetical protein
MINTPIVSHSLILYHLFHDRSKHTLDHFRQPFHLDQGKTANLPVLFPTDQGQFVTGGDQIIKLIRAQNFTF